MQERIVITQDEASIFEGGNFQQKGTVVLEVLGPGGKCDQFNGEHIVSSTFDALATRFKDLTDGTADATSPEEMEEKCAELLDQMMVQLKVDGYEIVFQ